MLAYGRAHRAKRQEPPFVSRRARIIAVPNVLVERPRAGAVGAVGAVGALAPTSHGPLQRIVRRHSTRLERNSAEIATCL